MNKTELPERRVLADGRCSAVVTGGAGFIGSHLVDALLRRGFEVLVIDDFSTGRRSNLENAESVAGPRLSIFEADITSAAAAAAIREFHPEVIIHHAAQMNVRRSVIEPVFDAGVNILGTVNLLEAGRLSGVRSFIFASSGGAIYGEQEEYPASETHPTRPESAYGVSKLCAEHYLEYYVRLSGMTGIALRYANVYGPRQNAKGEAGVVAIFCERLLAGESLRINGDGEQTRDFIYVDDVIAANLAVLDARLPSGFSVFNIGTGVETSVNGLAETLGRISGKPFRVDHGPALHGEQRRSVIRSLHAGGILGWTPKVRLLDGLCRTWESFQLLKGGIASHSE